MHAWTHACHTAPHRVSLPCCTLASHSPLFPPPPPPRFQPVAEEYVDDQGRPSGKRGLVVGGGAVRERAAYLLDPEVVPATELVVLEGQRGSLQAWVDNAGSADDFGTGLFDVDNVQRVAALDLRLANCDRHGGNLLVSEPADAGSSYRLTPIDHGCVLPESLEDLFFAWQYWRQVRQPVTPAVKAYVNAIDIEADLAVLSSIGISPASCAVYRATTSLLKAGVAAGLTLFDLAQLVTRPRLSEPSDLELALAGHDNDDSDRGDASTDDDAEEVDACGNGWTRTMTAHQVEQTVRDLVDAGLQ